MSFSISWPNTSLSKTLGVRYPIVQAPMGGGVTRPELVAAVANAGGLGSLGAGHMEPDSIGEAVQAIRQLTDRPFAVNLFIPQTVEADEQIIARSNDRLGPVRAELGLPAPANELPDPPDFNEQLSVLIAESVPIVSFTFGVPTADEIEWLRSQKVVTIGTATHLLEAIVLEESGIDVVVAQGFEAGGHRATFVGEFDRGMIGGMALVPLLVEQLRIPVVAAGGIMNGRGIVAALALGASGVQMGTAFLRCPESGTHKKHQAAVAASSEISTTLTRAFSGKPARGLRNSFTAALSEADSELPDYPLQHALTLDIRQAASRRNKADYMPLWAGQGCSASQAQPADELIDTWVEQIDSLLRL